MWRVRSWWYRFKLRAGIWIGYRMPMWVKYWCANDLIAKATTGEYGSTIVPELTAMEVLKRTGRAMGCPGYAE